MCDIKSFYVEEESYTNDFMSGSEEQTLKMETNENYLENARVINREGLRMRIVKEKVCIKPNIEEEFLKKGFEFEARFSNSSDQSNSDQSTSDISEKLKEFDTDNADSCEDKDDPIAPYLCEVVQKPTQGKSLTINDANPFHCDKCPKKFPRLQQLKQHAMSHSDLKPFECSYCQRRFKKASHLKTHTLTHTDDSPYKCLECNKKFTQDAALKLHMLKHSGIRPFLCKHCGKSFPKLYTLQRHELMHDESRILKMKQRRYNILTGRKYLNDQMDFAEGKKQKPGFIKQIHDEYNDQYGINEEDHNLNNNGEFTEKDTPIICDLMEGVEDPSQEGKAFQCPKCFKRFSRLTYLKQHQMTHSDFKPFACLECPMRFKKASHLKTHALTHTEDSPYKCPECGKNFTQDASLKSHLLSHSGIKPYGCRECGKKFTKLYTLQRHELTHTEDRPYQCVLCYKKFSDISNLKRHEATHSTNRPLSCLQCNKTFLELTHLKRHKLTHDIRRHEILMKAADSNHME